MEKWRISNFVWENNEDHFLDILDGITNDSYKMYDEPHHVFFEGHFKNGKIEGKGKEYNEVYIHYSLSC